MIVTIHQPYFFPWLPLFEKVKAADVFVVLANCQYEKNSYQNRFFYQDNWRTMSTNKGLDPITTKKYVNHKADWNKIKVNLKNKKKLLDEYDDCISSSLVDTNVAIIMKTLQKLSIKTKVIYDEPTELTGTERLLNICKNLNATTYLAGSSGPKYMDMKLFSDAGIDVVVQNLDQVNKVHTLDVL